MNSCYKQYLYLSPNDLGWGGVGDENYNNLAVDNLNFSLATIVVHVSTSKQPHAKSAQMPWTITEEY